MKIKKWMLALAFGLAGGMMHLVYVNRLEHRISGGTKVTVLVSAKKIEAGDIVAESSLAKRVVPAVCVDTRMVLATQAKEVLTLTSEVTLEPDQTIQWTDFAERKDPTADDLAQRVASGQRAITIQVDGALSMGGLLKPGHRVDILGTFAKRGAHKSDKVTATLLQNVTVLATGTNLGETGGSSESTRFATVTLSVGLEEAEILSLATTKGTLSLVLRGHQDLSIVKDVPEKAMADIWESDRRNALQDKKTDTAMSLKIERIKVR